MSESSNKQQPQYVLSFFLLKKTEPTSHKHILTPALLWENSPSPSRSRTRPLPFRSRSWPRSSPTSTTTRPRPTSPPAVRLRVAQWRTPWTTSIQIDNFYGVCIWAVNKKENHKPTNEYITWELWSSDMQCCVAGQVVPDIPSNSRNSSPKLRDITFQKAGILKYSAVKTAKYTASWQLSSYDTCVKYPDT